MSEKSKIHLVVEKDEAVLSLVEELGKRDYEVTVVSVEQSAGLNESIACLVVWLSMGAKRTWDVVTRLRDKLHDKNMILINKRQNIKDALAALEYGVYRYMEEPLDVKKLDRFIKSALKKRTVTQGDMVVERAKIDWLEVNAPASFEFAERLDSYLANLYRSTSFSHDEVDDISYAFLEMVNNAIEWGCKGDSTKQFKITYTVFSDKVIFKVEDEGEGFDFKKFFNVHEISAGDSSEEREAEGKREGGLGIYLVSQTMDEVKFNLKGNVVLMTKYFDS